MPHRPDTKEPARRPAPSIPPFKEIIAEGNAEITRRARIIVERTNSTGTYPDPKQLRLLGDDGTKYVFDLLKKQVLRQVSRAANASPQDIGRADPKVNDKPQIAAIKPSARPQQTASKPNIRATQSASTTQAQPKTSPPTKSSNNHHVRKAITTTSDWIEKQHPRRSGWWIAIRGVLLAAFLVTCAVLVARWIQSLPPFNA